MQKDLSFFSMVLIQGYQSAREHVQKSFPGGDYSTQGVKACSPVLGEWQKDEPASCQNDYLWTKTKDTFPLEQK